MKICPRCQAHYEDHVFACFADGSPLKMTVSGDDRPPPPEITLEPAPEPAPRSIPVLLPLVTGSLLAIGGLTGLMVLLLALPGEASPRRVAPSAERRAAGAIGAIEPAEAIKTARTPGIVETVPPTPVAPTQAITLTSSPSGAEVREHGALLCHTPCALGHPEGTELPRIFSLSAKDHLEVSLRVLDPSRPQLVHLPPTIEAEAEAEPAPRPGRPSPETDPQPRARHRPAILSER
ncbi:MAG TPA: hypothetical protein ENK18_21550 [Deltaproteobacteria bacterium]|nr:hypothetical protein [Deltaproteobacteria bacterium]